MTRPGIDPTPILTYRTRSGRSTTWAIAAVECSSMFNVNKKNPKPRVYHSSGKRGLPSFHWNGGHEDWDFPVDTDHKWWILFIFISYQNMWIVHVLFFFYMLQCWQENSLMFLELRTRECMMVMWINTDLSITFQVMIKIWTKIKEFKPDIKYSLQVYVFVCACPSPLLVIHLPVTLS